MEAFSQEVLCLMEPLAHVSFLPFALVVLALLLYLALLPARPLGPVSFKLSFHQLAEHGGPCRPF